MVYIALAAVSLLSCVVLSRKWALWKRIAAVAFTVTAAFVICYLLLPPDVLGPDNESWKAEVVLFFTLLIGMSAKYFWDLIEERQKQNSKLPAGSRKVALAFDFWDFVKPLLVSVIVFEAIAGAHHSLSRAALVGSFQNGFFWQTVFQKKMT
jgi:hypothetical protein